MKRILVCAVLVAALLMVGCYKPMFDVEHVTEEQLNPRRSFKEESGKKPRTDGNPFIDRVVEYCPAPGQFVNTLPLIKEGDPMDSVLKRCTECLANDARTLVHLGGFGGYISFAFDHRVRNREGRDFMIHGNAFRAERNMSRGNSEPGAVMVMVDENGNGLPDDGVWYELKGAGYDLPETVKGYKITYYRPDPNKKATKAPVQEGHPDYVVDDSYIKWTDNLGGSGYIEKNIYHDQSYWPLNRLNEETLSFTGTLLTNVAIDESGVGRYWTYRIWEYGYVDNLPNDEEKGFDISWAIDGEGHPVELDGIDFIRVYCCANVQAGWIGELSTEIATAWDLNLLDEEKAPRKKVR